MLFSIAWCGNIKTIHGDNEQEEKNVVLFLDLQNFCFPLTLLHVTALQHTVSKVMMGVGTKQPFSLAYCPEVIACVQDATLCTFLLCLQGQKPPVTPCQPLDLRAFRILTLTAARWSVSGQAQHGSVEWKNGHCCPTGWCFLTWQRHPHFPSSSFLSNWVLCFVSLP